ncbi:MAG TPA: tRNA lysidine(34) synthetase TilS [Pyrinomonadaceae bacterium]|nr:tRNA lysidine(34) synthetase TilS [Pyrinomonadaceae bacterium]
MKTRERPVGRAVKNKQTHNRPALSKFARRLLREWRRLQLPVKYTTTTIIGVSGGADSVALLLAIDELIKAGKLKLSLITSHVDHQLRTASAADARWVKNLAQALGYEIVTNRVDLKGRNDNLEQAARRARYGVFAKLAQKRRADLVLTAHTLDDQAETILFNLLRGSGAEGLGGMETVRQLNKNRETLLVRPFLSWARRTDTERYCAERNADCRHDEMNEDETFTRVRIRKQLLPLMQTFNPRIAEALARTGSVLRDDNEALNRAAARLLELSMDSGTKLNQVRTDLLAAAPPALRRRALRLWLEKCRGDLRRLEFAHIIAVEDSVIANRGARTIELPGGARVSRKSGLLSFKS